MFIYSTLLINSLKALLNSSGRSMFIMCPQSSSTNILPLGK